jgi:hypothetical protein
LSSRLGWYWNRLRCMSAGEVVDRLGSALVLRLRSLAAARPRAAPGPSAWAFGRPWFDGALLDAGAVRAEAEAVRTGHLRALSLGRAAFGWPPEWRRDPKTGVLAPLDFGPTMNLADRRRVGDIKYLWEPSRWHDLVPLAQAWRASGDAAILDAAVVFIDSWWAQNPHPRGPHWSSSLEAAIRLINASIAWHLLDAGAREGELARRHPGFAERWAGAMYWHLRFVRGHLSAHSSANNHLLGELAGLFVGASTWRCWPECEGWRREAQRRLSDEARRQNAPDGVNREQSSAYQLFVWEFLVLAGLCARADGADFAADYWQRVEAMCGFVAAITDGGGHMPWIGDADDGRASGLAEPGDARSLLALGALLFERADLANAAGAVDARAVFLLGAKSVERLTALRARGAPPSLPQWFPQGGYAVLGQAARHDDEVRLVFDAGPLGYLGIAAHGHADALALLLSARGEPLLIDPGTFTYHGALEWREHFRSTRAHNTLEIGGASPSLSGGRFMWVRHADATLLHTTVDGARQTAVGEHRGYSRGGDSVVHRRRVEFDAASCSVEVVDEVLGQGTHDLVLRWHAAPGVACTPAGTGFDLAGQRSTWHLEPPEAMHSAIRTAVEGSPLGWVSTAYERKLAAQVIECTLANAALPCTLRTRLLRHVA